MPERPDAVGLGLRVALALAVLLGAPAGSAQSAGRNGFPHDRALLQGALCGGRRPCIVESVLEAGRDARGRPLAVVHLSIGPRRPEAEGCEGYSDRLAVLRRGEVHQLRELSRGDVRCLEWHPSTWSFENGELVFLMGGMGAPPAADTEMRPTRTHFRPWPLALTARYLGTDRITPLPAIPPRGPLFVISMEGTSPL